MYSPRFMKNHLQFKGRKMKKVIFSMMILSLMILTGCGGSSASSGTVDTAVVSNNDASSPNTDTLALPEVPQLPVNN